MIRLVDDLLDVSPHHAAARSSCAGAGRPRDGAAQRRRDQPAADRRRRHELTLELPRRVAASFDADPTRLAQVDREPAQQRRQVHRPGRPDRAQRSAARAHDVVDPRRGHRRRHSRRACCRRCSTCSPRSTAALERSQGGLGIGLTLVKTAGRDARRHRPGAERGRGTAAARSSSACRRAARRAPASTSAAAPADAVPLAGTRDPGRRRQRRRAQQAWRRMLLEIARLPTWRLAHDGLAALREASKIFVPIRRAARHRHAGHERLRSGATDPPATDPERDTLLIALTGWGQEDDRARFDRGRFRPSPGQAGRHRGPSGHAAATRGEQRSPDRSHC